MRLRGTEWGSVFNSSGARGFFGEGYWFHHWLRPFGLDYTGSTFVAKTTTLHARAGNMPLDNETLAPKEFKPKCIVVKPVQGVVLNSVGLSGPGADHLIDRWTTPNQNPARKGKWMISFMSVAPTPDERVDEAKRFFKKLSKLFLANGRAGIALQINLSCPNVGLDLSELVNEGRRILDTANLGIPVLIKLNALMSTKAARVLTDHPNCDGLIISNTIPWGRFPVEIDWSGIFRSHTSPLAHMGGGGISGAPLLPIVAKWITTARTEAKIEKVIIGGGGVLCQEDARHLLDVGADAIELGAISILRPWRVRGIIDYVNIRTERS